MVTHGHFTVNGRKVSIPSYRVKPAWSSPSKVQPRNEKIKANLEANSYRPHPSGLSMTQTI